MRLTFLLLAVSSLSFPSFQIGIEGGEVWQTRNDLQRPQTDSNTRIALDEIDQGPEPFYRIEAFYRFHKNHGLRALYAPLSIELSNVPSENIVYNDQTFNAGSEVQYKYQFNSYRLTYFYAFWGQDKEQLNLGFTAKIRDAETRLAQGSSSASFSNTGFVPLLYFEYLKPISSNWSVHFSFDGLAGGPGRAFDTAFKIRRYFGNWGIFAFGARVLEGGVDNDKIYNFSLFQYASLEWIFTFNS